MLRIGWNQFIKDLLYFWIQPLIHPLVYNRCSESVTLFFFFLLLLRLLFLILPTFSSFFVSTVSLITIK